MRRLLCASVFLVSAACGSSADDKTTAAEAPPAPTAATGAPPAPAPAAGDSAKPPPPAPAEDTGTVVYAGKTTELSGDDFGICETVNPAFKGDFNIIAKLDDGTKLKLVGNVSDHAADHQGLILGEMPREEKATDLELTLEGRTLSGTAQTKAGPIEFRFEC